MNIMARASITLSLMLGALVGTTDADQTAKIARLRNDIDALIGPAVCSNLVNCRIAALGVDACGGPKEYLVYSWRSTDKAALEIKIAEFNLAQEEPQSKDKRAGACAVLPQPVAACVNGRCVLPANR